MKDVLALMGQANKVAETGIRPLVAKAGIEWGPPPQPLPPDAMQRLQTRLTPDEYLQFLEGVMEFERLSKAVKAAMVKAFGPGADSFLELKPVKP